MLPIQSLVNKHKKCARKLWIEAEEESAGLYIVSPWGGGGYTHLLFPTLKVNHFISAPKTDPRAHQSD